MEDSDPERPGIQTAIGALYTEYRLNEAHSEDGLIVVSAYNPDEEEVFTGQGVFFTARLHAVAALTNTEVTVDFTPEWTVQVSVWASDNLAGVQQIKMYVNEATDGSLDGDWTYAGRVVGSAAVILWDTRSLDDGLHQIAFTIEDRAGNWERWRGEDLPTILYDLSDCQVHLPIVLRRD